MVQQIEGLGDNNSNMVQTYAVLNEATKLAETSNQAKREALLAEREGESLIDKMKREQSKQDIDEHIGILATATVDTMQAYGELTSEAIKIRNMEAATKKQGEAARAMHSRGIASVASQLSTVMTAVNSAAINEAQAMAGSTLAEMTRVTNEVARKESIRIATGRDDVNTDLEEMLNQLAQFGDVQREATAITRDALTRMRENLAELEGLATNVGKDTQDFVGVAADVVAGVKRPEAETPPPPSTTPSPFRL
jgi:archaellum component FlaC